MRIKLQVVLVVILSFFPFQNVLSQSKEKQKPLTVIDFGDTIDEPLTSNELAQIHEVYGETTQENVLNHPQTLKDIKNILRNRVEIVDAGNKNLSGLPKLSSVELFNEYQSNVTRDFTFNPKSFNPLKYKFNFYSRNESIYHVDNTSFYIIIKSQYQ